MADSHPFQSLVGNTVVLLFGLGKGADVGRPPHNGKLSNGIGISRGVDLGHIPDHLGHISHMHFRHGLVM